MKSALGAIFYREFKIRTTNLVWLFFDLLVPMMYLLIFGLGFTRATGGTFEVGGRVVSYNEFFLAGVIAMASFGVAMNASWGWFMDRDNGIFDEMLTYPITRRQHLEGKVLFSLLLSIVEAGLGDRRSKLDSQDSHSVEPLSAGDRVDCSGHRRMVLSVLYGFDPRTA